MKLSTLFLLIGFLHVSAAGYSQVTLREKQAPLEKVLQKIEKQTNYVFIYDEDKLKTPLIDVIVNNVSVEMALDACFKNVPVSYSIVGNNIILKPEAPSLIDKVKSFFKVQVTLKGIVTDSTGRPLSRATVFFIKKKNQTIYASPSTSPAIGNSPSNQPATQASAVAVAGAITYVTDESGLFQLDADEGDEMGVSYIGYQTYTFKVKANMPFMNVVLHVSQLALKEVFINTGYQKLSKERATGSFSKPDMQVIANRSSTLDVVARLEGQIPGLVITPTNQNGYTINDATGAQTQKAVIRGESSVRLQPTPLYVLNGVIVPDFGALNVDNIADITVLKDASAAAIYGARAANGVIVVYTKTGIKNQGVKISYNGFASFEGKPDFDYARKRYLSSSQYIDVAKQLFDPVNYPYSNINSPYNYNIISPSQQILYNQNQGLISAATATAQLDSLSKIDNTSQVKNLWYNSAYTTNHTISASGGSNAYTIYGSLGYANSQGVALGSKYTSYKVNLSQSFTPNDRFSFSLDAQLANNINQSKSPLSIAPDVLPYQLFKDGSGNNLNLPYLSGWTPSVIQNFSQLSGIDLGTYKPLDELDYSQSKTNSYSINLVGNATVRLWKGFQYLGTYGYSASPTNILYEQDNRSYSYRKQLLNNTFAGNPPTYLIPVDGELYQSSNNNQRNWTLRNQLAYTYSGRDGNDLVSLQGGHEALETLTNYSKMVIYGFDPQLQTYPLLDYKTLNQGVFGTVGGYGGYLQQPFTISQTTLRYESYFGLASYTLNKKYTVDASWRKDHSNLFGSDVSAQNKPSYSIGGKWNLKNEGFMSGVKWLNALAIRGTYGVTGNSPYLGYASTFDILYAEQVPNYNYTQIAGPAYQVQSPQNKKVSWEATHTTNLGVDFGVFNNRLTGSVEYYHKNTTDLLGSAPVNFFTGSNNTNTNLGKLVNNGLNISLSSININSKDFSWQTNFIFGQNTNKLVEYEIPQSYQSSPFYKLSGSATIGYPLFGVFAYKYAGLDNTGSPQVRLADGTITTDPSKPTGDDLVYMGTSAPKFSGGLSNNFRYRQFRLSLNMVYNLGGVMRRDVNGFYSGMLASNNNAGGNINVDFLDRWQKPGDEKTTNIPAYLPVENYSGRSTQFYNNADINVVSASYLKLNEASLAYDFSPSILRVLRIQSASIRVQVNNILLWKANKYGINPEFNNPLYGARSLPFNQHTITLGANINF